MASVTAVYDVFLSHSSADKPAVEALARRLQEAGLAPFLDLWHLIPGQPWQEALEQALDASRTCAVFLGPGGLGAWENEEMRAALDARVQSPDFRVIPVLLPGASMPDRSLLPRFLARLTWVDFRRGLEDAEAFRRLLAGIRGVAPGPGPGSPAPPSPHPPYRGLEKFRPQDAEWFFGRDSDVQQLVEKLKTTRFLAVLGASGSGKSSVVLAGLVPALRLGALPGSQDWPVLIFNPTDQPLEELAVQLAGLAPGESTGALLRDLEADERTLHLAVRQALKEAPAEQRVVLVVDQFEEVFTLGRNEAARKQFFANLLYASGVESGRTVVVLTMRADFLSKCAPYPELVDRMAAFQFFITPMVAGQLREAIEGPAALAGLELEPGLADLILSDIADEAGALPLLEHALLELWNRREGRLLTFKAYREIGGVAGALTRTADALYASFEPSLQEVVQRILLRLVNPGEGTEDTTRRARLSELAARPEEEAVVEQVLGRLADERLVTTGRERDAGQVVVSLAHEALIKNWPLMQRWINENRESLLIHRRLASAAGEWERLNRDPGELYRGARLAQALEWVENHAPQLAPLEQQFLQAGQALHLQELEEAQKRMEDQARAEEQARVAARLRRLTRALVAALSLVFVLGAAAAYFAYAANANLARLEDLKEQRGDIPISAAWQIAVDSNQPPGRQPQMAGVLNIAVAEFATLAVNGQPLPRASEGSQIADQLYQELVTGLASAGLKDSQIEILGPSQVGPVSGSSKEERAQAAILLAERLNADLVIYGLVQITGNEGRIQPDYVISSRFDRPVLVARSPLFEVQDLSSQVLLRRAAQKLGREAQANVLMFYGQGWLVAGDYQQALDLFIQAGQIPGLEDSAKEVISILTGDAYAGLAKTNPEGQEFQKALDAYQEALSLNPGSYQARLAMAEAYYQAAFAQATSDFSQIDLEKLEQAEMLFQQVREDSQAATDPASFTRALNGLGRIDLARSQVEGEGDLLDQAQERFVQVVRIYESGETQVKDQAGTAHASLGLIHTLRADWQPAILEYQAAIELVPPPDQARLYAALGDLYDRAGDRDLAIQSYEKALEIAQSINDEQSSAEYEKKLEELKNQ